ncbi:MAG: hypothetical protein EHM45_00185 [Desulfobacteraceae bacterium]|nr:MAG: hypothetical protein EHM45_00185 [Desulfobacteraceae bacterium]
MSLLNAALRKKEKENRSPQSTGLFSPIEKSQWKSRQWLYGLAAGLSIIIGVAVLLALNHLSPLKDKPSIPSFSKIEDTRPKNETLVPNLPAKDILPPEPLKAVMPVKTDQPIEMTPQTSEQVEKPALQKKITLKQKKPVKKPFTKQDPENPQKAIMPMPKIAAGSVPPKPNKSDSSRLFYEKAVRYHMQNRLQEAILMYRQVLIERPMDTDTLFNLAAAYLQKRDFSRALPILTDLAAKDSNNAQILLNLAIAKMGTGEPDNAIALLDKALQIGGASVFELYFHKAVALSQLGRLEEAKRFYEMAGKIDPDNGSLLFNLAVLYDKMERYPEALQYYRAFLAQKGSRSEMNKEEVERRVLFLSGFMEKP